MRHLLAPLAAALLLAACGGDDEGPNMKPGSNCLSCHGGGDAPRFTAAGTIYSGGTSNTAVAGAVVTITPSSGAPVTLTTNSVGNFYTSAPLAAPLGIAVAGNGGSVDKGPHHGGACGSCHFAGNTQGAPSRTHVGACADCH